MSAPADSILLIDALWDYERPEESERRLRAELERTPPDTPLALELTTQIARALGLQRRFEQGHAVLDALAPRLSGAPARARIYALLERGRLLRSAGAPAQARPLFVQAWELACAAGEEALAVDAAHMLALVDPPAQQIVWGERALELARGSAHPRARRWVGSLLNNLGWTYHDLGQHGRALALFEQARDWRVAQGQPRELRSARWCVARELRALGRVAEALAEQQALLEQSRAAGAAPDGYICEEIAECLLLLDRADQARPYAAQALALLSADTWLAAEQPGRLERLRSLAGA